MVPEQQSAAVAGISSRRTACDKCRFAKARCLRAQQPDQSRCDRCSRTDSPCFTSPIFRLRSWQPPAASTVDQVGLIADSPDQRGQPRKRQRRHAEKRSPQASSATTPSESNGTLDEQLRDEYAAHNPTGAANNLATDRNCNANAHPSHPLDVLYGPDLGASLDGGALGSINHDFVDFSDHFFPTGASPSTADSAASPSLQAQNTQLPWGIGEIDGSDLAHTRPGSATEHRNGRPADDTPPRKLSQLHHELMATLSHVTKDCPGLTMGAIFESSTDTFHPSTMEQILNRTTEFAAILKLLAETHMPPVGGSAADTSTQIVHNKRPSNASSISICDHDSVLGSPADTSLSAEQSPSPITIPPAHEKLDMSSLLLILAIYMRLLKLHSVVFAHLHNHLKELSESEHPHLRPLLRFSINSNFYMPSDSGNLQILILLETVTSLFERLDALLGLPKELRISRRRREQQGLLSATDFLDLTSLILRKECQEGHADGKGGIKALRVHLAGCKQLLRECIAP
ncbi:hypothetical protein KVR01_008602 [Diaporthe batatas]|uniref:uncharacterized protein n=1 Tax=Diaporthe batatas TaxID=748121 RepID=UPI001D05A410|nr:uncharacterized protein KVR01_008602 [Diaporthe batatas]KAG8161615.1 hypothetical protein KVR01_008602 [Diaporthe batatas]